MPTTILNSDAPAFTGEFRHRIEGKNRITIPSGWRFGQEVDLFMICKTLDRCISVMPRTEVDRIKSSAREGMSPEARSQFLHLFGRNLRLVKLDKAGRISIPEEFCKRLEIDDAVVLSGAIDTFNIWNAKDFDSKHTETDDRTELLLGRYGI